MDEFLDGIFGWLYNNTIVPVINFLGSIFGFILSTPITRVLVALLFLNALGFFLMYHDKKIATKNGKIKKQYAAENRISEGAALTKEQEREQNRLLSRRTPESTLLLTALVGGSLGVLAGMYKFRHKTQKQKFTIGVPAIIVLQVIFIIWNLVSSLVNKG